MAFPSELGRAGHKSSILWGYQFRASEHEPTTPVEADMAVDRPSPRSCRLGRLILIRCCVAVGRVAEPR
jgi:hypothetical protein